MDQSLFAAPHGLSQRTTSFIACACQGIHQMPLRHLIILIADAHFPAADKATGHGYRYAMISYDIETFEPARAGRRSNAAERPVSRDLSGCPRLNRQTYDQRG